VPTPRWLIQHHFSPYDEVAIGKRYKLLVRVKGGERAGGDGNAFVCGTGGARGTKVEVPAADLADGKFHVVEVGEFTAKEGLMMYIALTRPAAMKEVYLDCLWLKRVD